MWLSMEALLSFKCMSFYMFTCDLMLFRSESCVVPSRRLGKHRFLNRIGRVLGGVRHASRSRDLISISILLVLAYYYYYYYYCYYYSISILAYKIT
jgi:hypothetical protein